MKRSIFLVSIFMLALLAACASLPQVTPGEPVPEQSTSIPEITATAPAEEPTRPAEQPVDPLPENGGQAPDRSNEFVAKLAAAIERKDFEFMSATIMDGDFAMAYWRSEGLTLSAGEAMRQMREVYLVEGSQPVTGMNADLRALLEGTDPLTMFGPEANLVRAFHVSGLGAQAQDEAIMVISRDPATGQNTWFGMLAAAGGFRQDEQPLPDETLDQQLARAIEARDFDALRGLMRDRFSFATFNTQLIEVSADEAIQQLRESTLAEGSQPAVRLGTDIPALLGGSDPLSLWGPVASPVRAMHVMGLNKDAAGEAVLVIGRDNATGELYWHGILLPQFGYFRTTDTDPNVLPTDVKYVMAKENVNLRSGPGQDFAVEGQIFAGQIAQVTGKSIDGAWWRIMCEQDSSDMCWVSADPSLTEPTTAP